MQKYCTSEDSWLFVQRKAEPSWLEGTGDGSSVCMPHCWNAADSYAAGSDPYLGWGSYRTIVELPEQDPRKRWVLCAGGFRGVGDLWVNGTCAAEVDGNYLGIEQDITQWLESGRNVIALRLNSNCGNDTLPGIADPDFVLYGGLTGGAWLEQRPTCDIAISALRVRDPLGTQPSVQLSCKVRDTRAAGIPCRTVIRVLDPNGKTVTSTTSLKCPSREDEVMHAQLAVANPSRWSLQHRPMYTVHAELLRGDEIVAVARRRFGIRLVEFLRGEGFLLNGARVALRGCNRHESIPGFGSALSRELNREDARLIAKMGLNFVRLSHYPQSPDFLDACDELGILVYAELASWKSVRGGKWLENAASQLQRMIERDHHHPCVILWGLGNESRNRQAYERLREVAYRFDPEQRAVIYAENHLYRAERKRTIDVTDVWGCNYEVDAMAAGIDGSRLGVGILSECANVPHARRGQLAMELEQLVAVSNAISAADDAGPACAGFALWSFNDYATPRKARVRRECGLLDAWRQPKLVAAWLRCRFAADAHLCEVRLDWSRHGSRERRVWVVTTGDGGTVSVGEERYELIPDKIPQLFFADVQFRDAPLVVEVRQQKQKLQRRIEAWGSADHIKAELRALGDELHALHLRVCDEAGRDVLLFEKEGCVSSCDNAELMCVGGNQVWFRGGSAMLYARRKANKPLGVEIRCEGLKPFVFAEEQQSVE